MNFFWWDRHIDASDPNWRRRIDESIRNAGAVFVLCTPTSRESDAVATEIELALSYNKPVYPLWLAGDSWARSAPFSLVAFNYTDLRVDKARFGSIIDQVVDSVVDGWPEFFQIDGKRGKLFGAFFAAIEYDNALFGFRPQRYESFLDLLNAVYDNLLRDAVAPASYGSEWCLRLPPWYLLPVRWAEAPGTPVLGWAIDFLSKDLASMSILKGKVLTIDKFTSTSFAAASYVGFLIPARFSAFTGNINDKLSFAARAVSTEKLTSIDFSDVMQICMRVKDVDVRGLGIADQVTVRPRPATGRGDDATTPGCRVFEISTDFPRQTSV